MHRRNFIAAIAASTVPTPTMASVSLATLIAAHKAATAEFSRVVSIESELEGRLGSEDPEFVAFMEGPYTTACDAEREAVRDLLAYRCQSMQEATDKAAYIASRECIMVALWGFEFETLVRSMAPAQA